MEITTDYGILLGISILVIALLVAGFFLSLRYLNGDWGVFSTPPSKYKPMGNSIAPPMPIVKPPAPETGRGQGHHPPRSHSRNNVDRDRVLRENRDLDTGDSIEYEISYGEDYTKRIVAEFEVICDIKHALTIEEPSTYQAPSYESSSDSSSDSSGSYD